MTQSPYRLPPADLDPIRERSGPRRGLWVVGAAVSLGLHALGAVLVPSTPAAAAAPAAEPPGRFYSARVGLADPTERPDALRRCFGSAVVRSLATLGGELEAMDPGGAQAQAWCDAAADQELDRGRAVGDVEEQRDCCYAEAEG